jgi:hypothetical protein
MTENQNVEVNALDSKFTKIAMTIVAVFLIFIGPTYVPYLLSDVLKVDYVASVVAGAVFFIVGLAVLVYLIRKRIIE